MKNREKYREEIIKAIKSRETCEFMNDTVIPEFIGNKTDSKCICEMGDCRACLIRFTLWLDEEHIEPQKPEVDWSKVPADTLVQVRNDENDKWAFRYFKWFVRGHRTPFVTWANGATSKTAEDWTEYWKYCELAEEDEDNGK